MSGHLALAARLLQATQRGGLPWRSAFARFEELASASLGVVAIGVSFFGLTMVTSADHEAKPIVQDIAVVGPPYFHLLVREFGPVLVGGLAALQLGARLAAEVGTQVQSEQLEAYALCGGDVERDLLLPRWMAGLLLLPLLLVVGLTVGAGAAHLAASWLYGSDGAAWNDPLVTSPVDAAVAAGKALLFGLLVPLCGLQAGRGVRGGPEAVGEATTRGAVNAFVAVLVADVLVAVLTGLAGV